MTNTIVKELEQLSKEIVNWLESKPPRIIVLPTLIDYFARWIIIEDSPDSVKLFNDKVKRYIDNEMFYMCVKDWIKDNNQKLHEWILNQSSKK